MRLLLVEDDVMLASGIKLGLSDAGYAVDWVGSAERAEEVLLAESLTPPSSTSACRVPTAWSSHGTCAAAVWRCRC